MLRILPHPFSLIGLVVSGVVLLELASNSAVPEEEREEREVPVEPDKPENLLVVGFVPVPPAESEPAFASGEPEPSEPEPASAPNDPEPTRVPEAPEPSAPPAAPPAPAVPESAPPAEVAASDPVSGAGAVSDATDADTPQHPMLALDSTWDEVVAFARATGSMLVAFELRGAAFRAELDPVSRMRLAYRERPGYASTGIQIEGYRDALLRPGEVAILLLPATLLGELRAAQRDACARAGRTPGPDVTTRVRLGDTQARPFEVRVAQ